MTSGPRPLPGVPSGHDRHILKNYPDFEQTDETLLRIGHGLAYSDRNAGATPVLARLLMTPKGSSILRGRRRESVRPEPWVEGAPPRSTVWT